MHNTFLKFSHVSNFALFLLKMNYANKFLQILPLTFIIILRFSRSGEGNWEKSESIGSVNKSAEKYNYEKKD